MWSVMCFTQIIRDTGMFWIAIYGYIINYNLLQWLMNFISLKCIKSVFYMYINTPHHKVSHLTFHRVTFMMLLQKQLIVVKAFIF